MSSASRRAALIIENLNISSIEDLQLLEQIAFERGAIVTRKHLDVAEARLIVGNPFSVITISTTIGDHRRQRFSIAHELGHLELHRQEIVFPCDTARINDWASLTAGDSLEQEANEFAASLLLPETLFAPLCLETDPSMDVVRHLSDQFNVSLMATARRYVRFCYDPVAVVWTQRSQIRWFQRNDAFADYGFFIDVNSLVDDATVASRFFEGEALPRSSRLVRASAWMIPGNFRDILLREQCVAMPNYDGVLSLLWVDEGWESEGWEDEE